MDIWLSDTTGHKQVWQWQQQHTVGPQYLWGIYSRIFFRYWNPLKMKPVGGTGKVSQNLPGGHVWPPSLLRRSQGHDWTPHPVHASAFWPHPEVFPHLRKPPEGDQKSLAWTRSGFQLCLGGPLWHKLNTYGCWNLWLPRLLKRRDHFICILTTLEYFEFLFVMITVKLFNFFNFFNFHFVLNLGASRKCTYDWGHKQLDQWNGSQSSRVGQVRIQKLMW